MSNIFKTKTYRVRNAAEAAASQGTALNIDKINTAVTQALSLWSSVAPLKFIPFVQSGTQVKPDIDIHFVNNGYTAELGNALIEINIGNRMFVDLYNETIPHPQYEGPFDLVAEIGHEVGHDLGIHHSPLIPGTSMEQYPDALMSKSLNENYIERYLKAYDIMQVNQLHGRLSLAAPIYCNLLTGTAAAPLQPGVHFIKEHNFVQLDGPVDKTATLTASISGCRNKSINAILLKFVTYSPNVIVNSVEVYDSATLIQKYYTCCRNGQNDTNQRKEWEIKLGLLSRHKVHHDLTLKINVQFKRFPNDNRWDFGVVQFESIAAEPLLELSGDFPPVTTVQ